MTAKEWLSRGFYLNKEIMLIEKELETAETLATGTVKSVGGEIIQSGAENSTERNFVRCAEYALSLKRHRAELITIKNEIFNAISKVDNSTLRTLLFARYINFETWEKIAADLEFSVVHIYRLHGKALKCVKID